MYSDLDTFCVSRHRTAGEAVAQMDKSRLGIVLVIDEEQRLVGTITDGDVRRALLADIDLALPVANLFGRKSAQYAKPITAPVTSTPLMITGTPGRPGTTITGPLSAAGAGAPPSMTPPSTRTTRLAVRMKHRSCR